MCIASIPASVPELVKRTLSTDATREQRSSAKRTAYSFGVTASGVRADWYHASDNENDANMGFDPVWEAKANIDALGWTAEMRIPFSQLRFTNQPVQVWGFNANRWNPATSEDDYWIPVPTDRTGWSSFMGQLADKLNRVVNYHLYVPSLTMKFPGIEEFLKTYQARAPQQGTHGRAHPTTGGPNSRRAAGPGPVRHLAAHRGGSS